jgi:hypothetical protein
VKPTKEAVLKALENLVEKLYEREHPSFGMQLRILKLLSLGQLEPYHSSSLTNLVLMLNQLEEILGTTFPDRVLGVEVSHMKRMAFAYIDSLTEIVNQSK